MRIKATAGPEGTELSQVRFESTAARPISPPTVIDVRKNPNGIRGVIFEHLNRLQDFKQSEFGPGDAPLARLIDGDYRTQLMVYAERKAAAGLSALSGTLSQGALDSITSQTVFEAIQSRGEVAKLWRCTENKQIISGMGSARDSVWNERLTEFWDELATRSVARGISNLNGGADTGAMGRQSRAWREAINLYKAGGRATDAEVMLVLLAFDGETTEVPCQAGSDGYVSPAMRGFCSRTPMLFGMGDQRVALINPGGIGTCEEFMRHWAENKIGSRVNNFFGGREGPTAICLNAELVEGKPFFTGFQKLQETMLKSGVADRSDFNRTDFYSLDDPKGLAELVVAEYEQPREVWLKEHNRSTRQPNYEREQVLLERLHTALNSESNFTKPLFGPNDPEHLRTLDAHFQTQVRLEVEAEALKRFRKGAKASSRDLTELFEGVVEIGVTLGHRWRDGLKTLIDACKDHRTLVFLGSPKDRVWDSSPEMQQVLDRLVRDSLVRGYSIVCAGDGKHGISGRILEAKERAKRDLGESNQSQIIRIGMKIDGVDTRAPKQDSDLERLGPPMLSLIARTPLILGLGQPSGVIAFPGGPYEMEIVAGTLLGAQLRDKVPTIYSSRNVSPDVTFINADLRNSGPFWNGFKDQLEMMKQANAMNPEHIAHLHFEDDINSTFIADRVFKRAEQL